MVLSTEYLFAALTLLFVFLFYTFCRVGARLRQVGFRISLLLPAFIFSFALFEFPLFQFFLLPSFFHTLYFILFNIFTTHLSLLHCWAGRTGRTGNEMTSLFSIPFSLPVFTYLLWIAFHSCISFPPHASFSAPLHPCTKYVFFRRIC